MNGPDQGDEIERALSGLALRGGLALAARAARRVLPILTFEDGPFEACEAAIRLAEAAAYDQWIGADQADAVIAAAVVEGPRPKLLRPAADDPRAHSWEARQAAAAAAAAGKATLELAAGSPNWDVCLAQAREAIVAAIRHAALASEVGAEAETARAARANDYERMWRRRAGTWSELGRPIDASEAGPVGPLWPSAPPSWYREGCERRLPPLDIHVHTVEEGATVEEIWTRESAHAGAADILCWDLDEAPGGAARLAATISELHRRYRAEGRIAPTMLVFSRNIASADRETLMAAGATVFSNTGPWSGVSRDAEELRRDLRTLAADDGQAAAQSRPQPPDESGI